jgi:hypothetical protein
MSGLLAGAAMSLTRHVLANAIPDAKADSKTHQKTNGKIGHRATLLGVRTSKSKVLLGKIKSVC